MEEIEPYILVSKKGFYWYYYLHIQGGSGHGKHNLGGKYRFYLFYLTPSHVEDYEFTSSPNFFCEEMGVPCGVGNTIEEAYADFKIKLEKNPLK